MALHMVDISHIFVRVRKICPLRDVFHYTSTHVVVSHIIASLHAETTCALLFITFNEFIFAILHSKPERLDFRPLIDQARAIFLQTAHLFLLLFGLLHNGRWRDPYRRLLVSSWLCDHLREWCLLLVRRRVLIINILDMWRIQQPIDIGDILRF